MEKRIQEKFDIVEKKYRFLELTDYPRQDAMIATSLEAEKLDLKLVANAAAGKLAHNGAAVEFCARKLE
ncbi:MAG TPA: hypothetical protein VGF97_14060 [Rhizomicrobium sp.]|jgi:hypothetical protein